MTERTSEWMVAELVAATPSPPGPDSLVRGMQSKRRRSRRLRSVAGASALAVALTITVPVLLSTSDHRGSSAGRDISSPSQNSAPRLELNYGSPDCPDDSILSDPKLDRLPKSRPVSARLCGLVVVNGQPAGDEANTTLGPADAARLAEAVLSAPRGGGMPPCPGEILAEGIPDGDGQFLYVVWENPNEQLSVLTVSWPSAVCPTVLLSGGHFYQVDLVSRFLQLARTD